MLNAYVQTKAFNSLGPLPPPLSLPLFLFYLSLSPFLFISFPPSLPLSLTSSLLFPS